MISSKIYFWPTKVKLFIRYFLSLSNFAKEFSSSSFESYLLGVTLFIIIFEDLKMSLGLLQYFDFLSSVYNLDIDFADSVFQVL